MQYATPPRSLREGVIIRTVEQKPKKVLGCGEGGNAK